MLSPNSYELISQNVLDHSLYRIGTIADGSCFFHCICTSLSHDYRSYDIDKRHEFVQHFRKQLADAISIETYKSIGNGELCVEDISKFVRKYMYNFYYTENIRQTDLYKKAKKYKDIELDESCKFICKAISIKDFIDVFESCFQGANISYTTIKNNMFKKLVGSINMEIDFYQFFNLFMECCLEKSYRRFIKTIKNANKWFNIRMLEIVMDLIQCNIYIFNHPSFTLYSIDKEIYKYNNNIFILWVDENHFETIGYLQGEEIILSCQSDEKIIQNIQKIN